MVADYRGILVFPSRMGYKAMELVNTMDLTKTQAGSSGDQPFLGKQNVNPQYPL